MAGKSLKNLIDAYADKAPVIAGDLSLNTLLAKPESRKPFLVLAEFVPLPGHKLTNFETFLEEYAARKDEIPEGFDLVGITIPQSPGGVASLNPADIYSVLDKKNLWDDLDVIPHVSTKDHNADALKSYLLGLQKLGIESVLALTGDKPAKSKGVFEIESVGLIQLLKEMNFQSFAAASPGHFDQVHQFFIAAAVSSFKYTQPSQMMQYYKMMKKIVAGADCLITQLGWDWRKSLELFQFLNENGLSTPVFGNVYVLTNMTPAPRLMYEGKLPGCLVTKELFDQVSSEKPVQHIRRAAQQVAMYRNMGAIGIDLGGVTDFDMFLDILYQAEAIGNQWQVEKENLDFGIKGGFYLYDDLGHRKPLDQPTPSFTKKSFDFFHSTFLEPGQGFHSALKNALGSSKQLRKGEGWLYNVFKVNEHAVKGLLFDCDQCGDCFLVENFGICSQGRCEKGISNAPCGDAAADGTCGNNSEIQCVGERIYLAAASEPDFDYHGNPRGLKKLATQINPPRNPDLRGTASILNYLFEKDHMKSTKLIQIGESVHASIPKPGAAMKELLAMGPSAYDNPSGPLDYIISIIESQIEHKADYIEINVDAFGEDDINLSAQMMRDYVRLVKKYGKGIPACIDSSDDGVLVAGLEEWYTDAPADIAKPLLNSVKTYTIESILPLNEKYPFKVIGLLVDNESAGSDGSYGAEELYAMAKEIFNAATQKYGFVADDLFFDSTVFPLAIDMPMLPDTPGYTYRAFEAIKKIMNDPDMKGVHTSLGISNCVKDLPGRKIGICRAYIAKAMECGLDAAIVNVHHDYGMTTPAEDLLELIDAYAKQDGSMEATMRAMDLMGQFCRDNRKAAQ